MAISCGDGDLIAAIYDASIDPSRWDEVVKRIVEATKSVSGGLHIQQKHAPRFSALCNCDPYYVAAFIQTYYKSNPVSPWEATITSGEMRTATHITETDCFKRSVFYNELIRLVGWADVVAIGLLRTPNGFGLLELQRSPEAVWVEPAEWHLLETLAPHLRRAAAIHDILSGARATMDSLGAAIAAAGFAAFLLTGDCRVLFANAKAEDLLRHQTGLRHERGRLAAASSALTHRLQALARHGSQPERGEGDTGGTLELPCGENRPPLLAHVIPLRPNRATAIFDVDRPAVAVFVVDPTAGLGAQIQRFAARFRLTAAETRVLAEIIAGNGLPAAAARLKISGGTVRTHAYRILAKTETNHQTELIRRFFETALSGSPAGI